MLSDSWPGIDENVEMGLREKKERFSSFKRFTPEKSLFFHCTMAKTSRSNKKDLKGFFDNLRSSSITYNEIRKGLLFFGRDEILGIWEFGNPEISHLFEPNLT